MSDKLVDMYRNVVGDTDNLPTIFIPDEIKRKADDVSRWFSENNIKSWALAGICSQNHARMLQEISVFIREKDRYDPERPFPFGENQ